MNKQENDIMNILKREAYINQRILAEESGHSLGVVNRSIKNLIKHGYLNEEVNLTEKAEFEFIKKAPRNAIILAAGIGMRMMPINKEVPKGLLEVNGEPLIERIIKQLHEVGITEIYIVVGFLKEQYEYLIDEYGVELIVNMEYAKKNNMHSLKLVIENLSNSYVIPSDIWCSNNPFNSHELYSWYMVSDTMDVDSSVRVNRRMELVSIPDSAEGNCMIGISYLLEEQAAVVREKVMQFCEDSQYDNCFWEEALYNNDRMIVQARIVRANDAIEINTFEQLRELDGASKNLKSDILKDISEIFKVNVDEIKDITALKKGMTNHSFIFNCKGKKYIMRIPGEGTEQLIKRNEEAAVYQVLADKGICDNIIYFNSSNGYKITEFLEGARVCNPLNIQDLKLCMEKLREFHEQSYKVEHEFNVFGQIDFYESLWNDNPSVYRDYYKTKEKVFSLRSYINKHGSERVLTHIDAIPDNFLFVGNKVYLIDWEYAGMQDPHMDIAMFSIYSLYKKEQVDQLIEIYFKGECSNEIRVKIYCYISVCGLLWSNWCEYKRCMGVEFGEYSLRQYRYAKDYYEIVKQELDKMGEEL